MKTLVIALTGLLVATAASAKNTNGQWDNAPHKEWYQSQFVQGPDGQRYWCCDMADAEPFYGDYTLNTDGSVTLDNGVHLPAFRVLTDRDNPTGHAVWWHTNQASFCFAPGPLM